MKVLHIVNRIDAGGISSFLYNYYTNMDHDKIQFDIIAIDTGRIQDYHYAFEELGMHVYYMPNDYMKRLFCLHSILHRGHYDIVHCHIELYSAVYLAVAFVSSVKVRIAHTHMTNNINNGIKNRILRFFLNKVATVRVGASDNAITGLFGKKYKKKSTILYNAVNIEEYSYNEKARNSYRRRLKLGGKFVVGFVGRLTYLKNIFYALEVFASLKKMHHNSVLLIVGEGELREQLIERIKLFHLEDSIFLLGTRNDVNNLMMAMDVMLLPSFNEGLGIVLIEAQAAALKCVASLKGVPLETNISPYIYYKDIKEPPEEWADLIMKECFDYERKAIDATIAKHRFDIKSEAKQLFLLYEEALKV